MPKYKEEQESRYISRTVAILSELPEFCTVFYDKNQTTFLPKTQYDYMRAMRSFLTYQQQSHPYFNDRSASLRKKSMKSLRVSLFNRVATIILPASGKRGQRKKEISFGSP